MHSQGQRAAEYLYGANHNELTCIERKTLPLVLRLPGLLFGVLRTEVCYWLLKIPSV